MKSLVIIITGLLSLFAVDLNLFKNFRHQRIFVTTSTELTQRKTKHKRRQRLYLNQKYKKKICYVYKAPKYKSTKPKAHRFSNQKSLRRMYRNC